MVLLFTAVLLTGLGLIWWSNKERRRRLIATVTQITIPDFPSEQLGNRRRLTILLPPAYEQSQRTYKTLYVNDGQDSDALKLRETVATLIARKRLPPLIVVAIDSHADRLQEYGTAVAPNAQQLGNRANDYAQFITQELVPYINKNYRVSGAAQDTAVLGASLGGLSAFDMAWQYPHIFGIVGIMSGSFWWRAAAEETRVPPGRRIAHSLVRSPSQPPTLRFWFQAATQDEIADRDNDGVIDAIQDTLELMTELAKKGYQENKELIYVEVPGGRHNYDTWSEVLPHFLVWAFAAR